MEYQTNFTLVYHDAFDDMTRMIRHMFYCGHKFAVLFTYIQTHTHINTYISVSSFKITLAVVDIVDWQVMPRIYLGRS